MADHHEIDAAIAANRERDRRAYTAASKEEKEDPRFFGALAYGVRWIVVEPSKLLLLAAQGAYNIVFLGPYRFISNRILNPAVRALLGGLKYGVDGIVWARKLLTGKDVSDWGVRAKAAIDNGWAIVKRWGANIINWAGEKIQRYGMVGLYRVTKAFLDPRTKDGKPAIGELLNKGLGFIGLGLSENARENTNKVWKVLAAGALVAAGAFAFGKLFVLGKIMHLNLTLSLASDPSPWAWKLAKQALYHPAITIGITAVKTVVLPVLAAGREALKTIPFFQRCAHVYMSHVENANAKKLVREAKIKENRRLNVDRIPFHNLSPEKKRDIVRYRKLSRIFSEATLRGVDNFVNHIWYKAAPETYEAMGRAQDRADAVGAVFKRMVEMPVPAAPEPTFTKADIAARRRQASVPLRQ